jgi:hypothetical protein
MQTQSELVEKYYNGLNEIYTVLKYTDKVSMSELVKKNGLSNETVNVLKKGNVIKLTGKAKGSKWQWLTITPTKQMAFKTLKDVQSLKKQHNAEQRKKIIPINITPKEVSKQPLPIPTLKRGGYRENSGRKSKAEELKQVIRTIEFSLFWGLVKYKKQ